MSPGKRPANGFSPGEGSSSRQNKLPIPRATRPQYMTVGSGSTPESAARLVAMLDEDSGYGGSVQDGDHENRGWNPGLTEDRPTMSSPILPGDDGANELERRSVASHVVQLYYNQNRTALGRAIHGTIESLSKFREFNMKWPAHYPPAEPSSPAPAHSPHEARPGLVHTQSTLDNHRGLDQTTGRPAGPKRAGTSLGEDSDSAESSSSALNRSATEPRLVSAQLTHDYSVLKLELKLAGRNQTDLVHSLEKNSVASLLDRQIGQSIRHLQLLKERIEDTASKVLVTGDLNAGKSTFCNALLRRKVLPEDQQPCTSIFCEVLDVRENGGIEEVHAVPPHKTYNRHDESTYDVYQLKDLERIVTDNERYSQCKIYIKDIRAVDASLLNNGVVDIALIDAPGLNSDSLKTTAIFARQEEIDVVVFVVSAANHFTQSAKEFIFNAAREKAYIFMVVNGFDNIKDQERCQEMILKQVQKLSPATFKESADLVHFVSSNAIPVALTSHPGSGSGSDFPGDDDDGDDDKSNKGKGKEREKIRDFEELEAQLRRFVLEKRSKSKLAPARTYLLNVLGDLHNLAVINQDVAQREFDRVTQELDEIVPAYEERKSSRAHVDEKLNYSIETAVTNVYEHTRLTLNTCIDRVAEQDLGIPYPGLLSAYQFAEDLKEAMLTEISETVSQCEEYGRTKATQGFNTIKNMGILHLGNAYATDVIFLSDRMFRKQRHALARQVDVDVELWDFFDVTSLWERQEKFAGTGMALTVAGVLGGRLVGGIGWVDGVLGAAKIIGANNLRRLAVPGIILTAVIGVSYALASIPSSLPRRLSAKLSTQLQALDYTHTNASRISAEVRRALRQPASDIRVDLQRSVEKLQAKKEETSQFKIEVEAAKKYFTGLVRGSNDLRQGVERVDLEGPPPGLAATYF